jgi:hypothetical protein
MSRNQDVRPFPLPLPASLASYNELFVKSPEEAIKRLEAQFKKRVSDPVCSVVLSWFYYQTDQPKRAMEYAVKAKFFAPGSPSMSFAPYFLEHPTGFEAWTPEHTYSTELPGFFVDRALSLDELIERLSSAESSKIMITEHSDVSVDTEIEQGEGPIAPYATETLANIYEKQGETELALAIYEILLTKGGDKADHYQSKIDQLRSTKSSD